MDLLEKLFLLGFALGSIWTLLVFWIVSRTSAPMVESLRRLISELINQLRRN